MSTVMRFNNVSKRFGKVQALNNVSFEIESGRVVALLGANGAGKTTAIRILLGLERPSTGEATVLGMNCLRYQQEIRRRVGYVPEKPALYDWMTVEEIGWFTAGFYAPGYAETYQRYIKQFGVKPEQIISKLSKGTRSKVALSLALAHSPELLILDEPTSGLDPLVRREFLESMVDVAGSGRTVLLCSHQVNEVERIADDVIILMNGKIVCYEPLEELKQKTHEVIVTPRNTFTNALETPGRLLARVENERDHVYLIQNLDHGLLEYRMKSIGSYQVRQPTLEEILLTLLRERRFEEQYEDRQRSGETVTA